MPTTTTTLPPSGSDLDAARARWEAAALGSYHFVFQDDCGECMPEWAAPRVIAVWEGEIFDGRRQGVDVDTLFSSIEAAAADGREVEVDLPPGVRMSDRDLDRPGGEGARRRNPPSHP